MKRLGILALIATGLTLSVCQARVCEAQVVQKGREVPWEIDPISAVKGTRIRVPQTILKEVKANPDDCLESSAREGSKLDAYRFVSGNRALIAIWGRSSCYCSPTGNCTFWIYKSGRAGHVKLLDTGNVREFGFLRNKTKGLPDIVLWSHDSALRSPGALWQFDGKEYVRICGWEWTSQHQLPNGDWEDDAKPHIENNTCVNDKAPAG